MNRSRRAIVLERRHHAVWVKGEVFRLELVTSEQVELDLLEGEPLGIEHEAHALAAGRLGRVVEGEGHSPTLSLVMPAAAPPSAASNSRRPMVTVIRPSRARCVNGTIPRHERAVFTFGNGDAAALRLGPQ